MSLILNVTLPYAMTVSAYYLQKLSELTWIESIVQSTRLSQISSIRHYRASIMMKEKFFFNKSLDIQIDDLSNIDSTSLIDVFLDNDEDINTAIHSLSNNDQNHNLLINNYYLMTLYTRRYAIWVLNINTVPNELTDKLDFSICLQCGNIFKKSIEDVTECDFCGAGLNHIITFNDLL